jgi:CDP-diacylglycerol--glycerol-3-phosphate 3-phosphatidyltransferase
MARRLDPVCSCVVLASLAAIVTTHALRPSTPAQQGAPRRVGDPLIDWISPLTMSALSPIAHILGAAGVSANTVTGVSLVAGVLAGAALALGHFGVAVLATTVAFLGDAMDGLLARHMHTASPGGALFDASADRYEEFFVLGGLALFFRSSPGVLAIALLAMVGSFMVSYGSAMAEAHGVPVPGGIMRRASRAAILAAGITLVPITAAVARSASGFAWLTYSPALLALAVIAVGANVSAVIRLRVVAHAASRRPATAYLPKSALRGSRPIRASTTRTVSSESSLSSAHACDSLP